MVFSSCVLALIWKIESMGQSKRVRRYHVVLQVYNLVHTATKLGTTLSLRQARYVYVRVCVDSVNPFGEEFNREGVT
jgi:hypothetical protein